MSTVGYIFLSLALVCLGLVLIGLRETRRQQRLDLRLSAAIAEAPRPRAAAWRLPQIFATGGKDREEIERSLRNAGLNHPRALEIFIIVRLVVTAFAVICVGIYASATGKGFFGHPIVMMAVAGLAYIACKLGLGTLGARRLKKMASEFPFMLDLMFMMLQSGISLDQCLRTLAAQKSSAIPYLQHEFGGLVSDLDRGLSYEAALDRWAARIPINSIRELASVFKQALFHGIELIPSLREFGKEFSAQRVANAKEAMGRITVRMVILMIVFFMPSMFIVVGGPPVIAIFDTLAQTRSDG